MKAELLTVNGLHCSLLNIIHNSVKFLFLMCLGYHD